MYILIGSFRTDLISDRSSAQSNSLEQRSEVLHQLMIVDEEIDNIAEDADLSEQNEKARYGWIDFRQFRHDLKNEKRTPTDQKDPDHHDDVLEKVNVTTTHCTLCALIVIRFRSRALGNVDSSRRRPDMSEDDHVDRHRRDQRQDNHDDHRVAIQPDRCNATLNEKVNDMRLSMRTVLTE